MSASLPELGKGCFATSTATLHGLEYGRVAEFAFSK
jgi:hypothetical protein